ncbi:MAG TPA: thymidine kinase [Spirochaetia bacterium]|nr:thymidine kinase [Spirochaetia bacterium]
MQGSITGFLKSLGFPELREHQPFNHFDFARPSRRILVIGPMGSGKTEYSSRVWRDSQVVLRKSSRVSQATRTGDADRRNVFFIRSTLDRQRFPDYPQDALPFRGGYERCGDRIADIESSFDLERLFEKHPEIGTWIIDEAAFYEERLAYIVNHESESRGLIFIFPTLILNFRREIFNSTARLLLEMTTDVFPLSAYCEHPDCVADAFYTYRYYLVEDRECPALYFDPLIIVGGDREKRDPREPNYCSRCDEHHHLPGKEYTYLILKPLGEEAARSNLKPLREELANLARRMEASRLYSHFKERYAESDLEETMMSSLRVPCIAEKALIFLYAEQNLVSRTQMEQLMGELTLDREFIRMRLRDNGRSLA